MCGNIIYTKITYCVPNLCAKLQIIYKTQLRPFDVMVKNTQSFGNALMFRISYQKQFPIRGPTCPVVALTPNLSLKKLCSVFQKRL